MEQGITKNQIISELTRSPHGDLAQYVPVAQQAAAMDPEFLAHLISWNEQHGSIRDSKVALPVVSLSVQGFDEELKDNSLAHLALLDPRNLVRAVEFAKQVKIPGNGRALGRLVERYLRARERNPGWWIRTALSHKASLKRLYALHHLRPITDEANSVIMRDERPEGSVFWVLGQLKTMEPAQAAGEIAKHKIPFLVALGALGARAQEEPVVLALIDRMSATEIVTNTKALEKMGLQTSPALRAAYEQKLEQVKTSKQVNLKAQRASEAQTDEGLKAKLAQAQSKQMEANAVEGDWLVLGDKSGSMASAIEGARVVAATLAKMAKGRVSLVFFDTMPRHIDVTGKSYDEILEMTKRIQAGGGTSIGCGLQWAVENKVEVDGIAIVSDAEENAMPIFASAYAHYSTLVVGKKVPVYLYMMGGRYGQKAFHTNMHAGGHDFQEFKLSETDYHSLPNLVATMRTNRYGLIEEVMDTPLLTVDGVFKKQDRQAA